MFEKFTRHLSGKENDGAKTGESFKIATPGSSLDYASTGPDRLAISACPLPQREHTPIENCGPGAILQAIAAAGSGSS
jgi:hypothetical protein